MKILVITLSFALVITALTTKEDTKGTTTKSHGTRYPTPPGCANPPKGTKLSDCCKSFPTFFSKDLMAANCTAKCKGSDRKQMMCCFTDCAMDSVGVLTNGKFDATKSKQILAKLTDKSWTPEIIAKVVDDCVASAPEKLNKWRSTAPKEMTPNCTETTSLNMVLGQCIRRELFFQCPGMAKTEQCKALVDFGKGCPFFPFHDGPPGAHHNGPPAAPKKSQ